MNSADSISDLVRRIGYVHARYLAHKGDPDEAERFLKALPEPLPVEHLILRGKLFAQRQRYAEAIATWRQALEADPGNVEAREAILVAERMQSDPRLRPDRRLRRFLVRTAITVGALGLIGATALYVAQLRSLALARDAITAENTKLLRELHTLRQDHLEAKLGRCLQSDPRLVGYGLSFACSGDTIRCSGEVPTEWLRRVAHDVLSGEAGGKTVDCSAVIVTGKYTTIAGDILSGIAQRLYGDGGAWHKIQAANRERIQNPDVVPPGIELRLPEGDQ